MMLAVMEDIAETVPAVTFPVIVFIGAEDKTATSAEPNKFPFIINDVPENETP